MLSESQERMLLATAPEHVPAGSNVFEKWDIACWPVETVTARNNVPFSTISA